MGPEQGPNYTEYPDITTAQANMIPSNLNDHEIYAITDLKGKIYFVNKK